MMRGPRIAAAFGLVIALTVACGGDVTESEEYRNLASEVADLEAAIADAEAELAEARRALASGEEAVALHPVPDGSTVVWGTAACDFGEGETGMVIVCDLDMSDPRVGGTETHDGFEFLAGRVWVGGVWVAAAERGRCLHRPRHQRRRLVAGDRSGS